MVINRPTVAERLGDDGDNFSKAANADHGVNLRQVRGNLGAIALGQTAGDNDFAQPSLLFQLGHLKDIVYRLALGAVYKAASVDYNRVRAVEVRGQLIASVG